MTIKTKPTGGVGLCAAANANSSRHYTIPEDNLEPFLSKLEKVRPNGRGCYTACCPAHHDKHPSLAIRQTGDGKILLKCFGGCSAYEIVNAVGLSLTDLFPSKDSAYSTQIKNPFPAAAVLRCIQFEALVVATAACNIANGMKLSDDDLQRLVTAASRIGACYE